MRGEGARAKDLELGGRSAFVGLQGPARAKVKGLYGTNARGLYIIYPGTVGLFGLGERGDVGTLAQ